METDLFQATVEFPKFAGILRAALPQHHLLDGWIALPEIVTQLAWVAARSEFQNG